MAKGRPVRPGDTAPIFDLSLDGVPAFGDDFDLDFGREPGPVAEPDGEEEKMRRLVVAELRKRWPDARIVHELPLFAMSGGQRRRIDLAAITANEIVVVEIKSGRDVLDRLEAQIRAFLPVASRVIVALAPAWTEPHPKRRAQADAHLILRTIDEPHVEPWIVDAAAGTVTLGQGGVRPSGPWLSRMIAMLDRDELAEIARRHRLPCGRDSTREDLLRDCVDHMTGREIVAATCAALRARDRWIKYGSDRAIPLPDVSVRANWRGGTQPEEEAIPPARLSWWASAKRLFRRAD